MYLSRYGTSQRGELPHSLKLAWSMGQAHLRIRDNLQMLTGLKPWDLFNGQSKTGIRPHQNLSFRKNHFIHKYFYSENYSKIVHYQRKKLYFLSGTELFKKWRWKSMFSLELDLFVYLSYHPLVFPSRAKNSVNNSATVHWTFWWQVCTAPICDMIRKISWVGSFFFFFYVDIRIYLCS